MGVWSRSGETSAAPKGVEHKSSAASEVKLMLIEPKGAVNTSDAGERCGKNEVDASIV